MIRSVVHFQGLMVGLPQLKPDAPAKEIVALPSLARQASIRPTPALYVDNIAACLLVLCATLAAAAGCRCYHVGNQFSWRSDIRTVHVGIFDSDSYRRFLGQRLTEAVIREIGLRTPLTITEPAVADSFVQGRIIRDQKQVLGENRFDEPRAIGYGWVMEVTWVDRAGQPLMQRQLIQINDDVTFIPEGGQSLASAELELVESLARQVVGQMEMPW